MRDDEAEDPGGVAGRAEMGCGKPSQGVTRRAQTKGALHTLCEREVDVPYERKVVRIGSFRVDELGKRMLAFGHDGV